MMVSQGWLPAAVLETEVAEDGEDAAVVGGFDVEVELGEYRGYFLFDGSLGKV